jgi:ZIP family zinc transporter
MVYVSLVDLLAMSREYFQKHLEDSHEDEAEGGAEKMAYLYATVCLFGGMVLMRLIDVVTHSIGHTEDDLNASAGSDITDTFDCGGAMENGIQLTDVEIFVTKQFADRATQCNQTIETEFKSSPSAHADCMGCWSPFARSTIPLQKPIVLGNASKISKTGLHEQVVDRFDRGRESPQRSPEQATSTVQSMRTVHEAYSGACAGHSEKKLAKMGLSTAMAIGIHNFPEGLASFVATLADPSVGIVVGIAIGIHNIPEGLCVALPIYYAHGSRIKGFLWGTLSGVTEPIGALIGWLLIKMSGKDLNSCAYAILFGVVGGMMLEIVNHELLPTAHSYDPQNRVVSSSFAMGMFVMASSLVMFTVS